MKIIYVKVLLELAQRVRLFVLEKLKIKDIIKKDFGKPLHSVVICAKTLSSIEKEVVKFYSK